MGFKEKLKEKRIAAGMTQVELAAKAGASVRTIQNYELGARRPQTLESVIKVAEALNTTADDLLGQSGYLVLDAQQKGGSKAAKDVNDLVEDLTAMFAGGKISEDAMDGAMQALNRAYWMAKDKNKKYTPKKYKKDDDTDLS